MINLLYEPFPETVFADGISYPVRTDFRQWMHFADVISEKEITEEKKCYCMANLLKRPEQKLTEHVINALFDFYHARALEPDSSEDEEEECQQERPVRPPVFDWKFDGKYILADFRRYYAINLLSVNYLHWWEFRTLFFALPDESHCQKRINYRSADLSKIPDDAERKRVARIQKAFALPFELDDNMIGDIFRE